MKPVRIVLLTVTLLICTARPVYASYYQQFQQYFELKHFESLDFHGCTPLLQGHLIEDTIFQHLIGEEGLHDRSEFMANGRLFATFRFLLTPKAEVFVVRFYNKDHFFFIESYFGIVFNPQTEEFIDAVMLDVQYEEEGIMGSIRSLISDVDNNGIVEFVQLQESMSHLEWYYEVRVLTLDDNGFMRDTFEIEDFNESWGCDSQIVQSGDMFGLKRCLGSLYIPGERTSEYGIVVSTDTSADHAYTEIDRLREWNFNTLGERLYLTSFFEDVYCRNGKYYVILHRNFTENTARLSLIDVQNLYRPDAFLVDLKEWCEDQQTPVRNHGSPCYSCPD
ncbi:MAG: hypothetical protein JJ975_06110 [Bacteroidia bacterium]|nr:hypothetical protein [Bacteroidia bacterium]